MGITKDQIFEMYINAAGFSRINSLFRTSKVFRNSNGEKKKEEELKGSSEFAGFIDAVMGNSPKYLPPKGTINHENSTEHGLASIVRSFTDTIEDCRETMGEEGLEMLKQVGYLKGYELGLQNKGVIQRTPNISPHPRVDIPTGDDTQKVISLAAYRGRTGR